MTDPNFRPLTSDDAKAFAALSLDGAERFPEAFLMTAEEARAVPLDRTEARLASGWMHGAFHGETLIGFAGLEMRPWAMAKHRAQIGPFYIASDHHGTGLSGRFMGYLADVAQARGVTQLELWVAVENRRARTLYADQGFRAKGRMPAAVILDGTPRDDIFMVRDLSEPLPAPGGDGLRRLGPGDWRAFRNVRLDMLTRDPTGFGSTHADWAAKAPDEVAEWLRELRLWAVVEGGRVLATVGWARQRGAVLSHRGHVIAVYTRPDARGRGLARRLLDAVAEDARAQGVAQLELDVGAENTAARAAYEAAGYVVTGGIPRCLNHDGHIQNQLLMVRPL